MGRIAWTALWMSLAILTMVSAKQASQATVQIAESALWGSYLATPEGDTLYIYLEDEQGSGASACVDACTSNWPPFTVEGEPVAGEGIDQELLGTITRDDGSTQVTYDGWPLYTYARDTAPGQTRGAALGEVFYLISGEGESLTERMEREPGEIDEDLLAQLMSQGEQSFAANCAVCHGAEGQGAIGPVLAGNDELENTSFLVRRIINGSPEGGMPPFGHLSDEEIAGIATFARNSWGNDFGAVISDEVVSYR